MSSQRFPGLVAAIAGAAPVDETPGARIAGLPGAEAPGLLLGDFRALRVAQKEDLEAVGVAGGIQALDRRPEVTDDPFGILLENRHHERGAAAQRPLAVEPAHEGHDRGDGVGSQLENQKADDRIPEADDRPGQGDDKGRQHQKIDDAEPIGRQHIGEGRERRRHRRQDEAREDQPASHQPEADGGLRG